MGRSLPSLVPPFSREASEAAPSLEPLPRRQREVLCPGGLQGPSHGLILGQTWGTEGHLIVRAWKSAGPRKASHETTVQASNFTSGLYPKEWKGGSQKRYRG